MTTFDDRNHATVGRGPASDGVTHCRTGCRPCAVGGGVAFGVIGEGAVIGPVMGPLKNKQEGQPLMRSSPQGRGRHLGQKRHHRRSGHNGREGACAPVANCPEGGGGRHPT